MSAQAPASVGLARAASSVDSVATDSLPLRLKVMATLAEGGDGRGQVQEPSGVAVDAFGRVTLVDAALNRVLRFDSAGHFLGESGALGSDVGQLRRPGAAATLGTLSVAVLDRENHRVVSYDLFGQLLGTVIDLEDSTLTDQVGRVDPVAMAADRGGALYVADADRDRLLAFDFSGRYLRAIGGFGGRPGSFRGLSGVATLPHGELATAERVNARIQHLDAGGRVVASWPLAVGAGRGELPVAADDSARVAVADERSGRLWVFDARGRPLAGLAGLDHPRALAFAPGGSLLVAETRRVRRFALEPAPGH